MRIYREWISRLDEHGLMLNAAARRPHSFEWGLHHIGLTAPPGDSHSALEQYNARHLEQSRTYFTPDRLSEKDYSLKGDHLTFSSSIRSAISSNNTVHCTYLPTSKPESIVIVVPHWNAYGDNYDTFCRHLNRFNFASLRISLPYHDDRNPPGTSTSSLMVSANIGRTIQAMQQSVRDIISAVDWLELRGYRRVGIIGASIGSCAAFLAAVHDRRIQCIFANHMSSHFGDIVWTGASTSHVRSSLTERIDQGALRSSWTLNSPVAFVNKIREYNPELKQCIVSAKYDTTFQWPYTEELFAEYDHHGIRYQRIVLPCGHYSLGRFWFNLVDGLHVIRFFQNALQISLRLRFKHRNTE